MRGQSTEQSELLNGGEVEILKGSTQNQKLLGLNKILAIIPRIQQLIRIYRLSSPEHNYK